MVFYIIIALIFFGLLIAVHEGGHFLAAKLLGVRVNEFSIGMGPKLFSKQRGETLYSLRAIPMGGFCAMEGEDEATDSPDSFSKKATWKKLIILAAGSAMNFVAGLVIILILFLPKDNLPIPVLGSFMDGFPNQSVAGLLPGDRIVSINGKTVNIVNDANLYLSVAKGDAMDLVIERDGQRLERADFPLERREYLVDGKPQLLFGLRFQQADATPALILSQTWDTAMYFGKSVWMGFQMLFGGDAGIKDLSGPVGIVSMIGETGTEAGGIGKGLYNVAYIIALVAVNLAVVNMLPIPALDGGRIFLLLIGRVFYMLTRRNINPKHEAYIHAAGFLALILLMLFVTFQDVIKLLR